MRASIPALVFPLFLLPAAFAAEPPLPPPAQRAAMVSSLAAEMERLDAEALLVRGRNRALSFGELGRRLAGEAREAGTWEALLRTFARLDAAYPNLHARASLPDWFRPARVRPVVRFTAEWLESGTRFVITHSVESGLESAPKAGDRLLAINGRPMESWSAEHLELCKWPLREQCDVELYSAFRKQLLSWTAATPLTYTLERDGSRFETLVALEPQPDNPPGRSEECGVDAALYPGFTLAYRGRYACLFTKDNDASTVIFRISSFYYDRDEGGHAIDSVHAEVEALWPWWRARAPRIRHLLLDLASNHGGNEPTPYYELLFERAYQEQWARFKKLPELLRDELRKEVLFWGTPQQETWFQNLRREGTWDSTAFGDFLPPVPMFCAGDERSDCRHGLFPVRNHGFRGRVTLLLNHWCVSSCDGFAYEVKEQLGVRVTVAGQPQAADTAYSRATIELHLDPSREEGFRLSVEEPGRQGEPALLSQSVSVTRSVLEDGTVVSGLPLRMDRFLGWPYQLSETEWRAYAMERLAP